MTDRAETFERVLRPEPGRTALLEIRRATLDIVRRAYGRVASTKEIVDDVSAWDVAAAGAAASGRSQP
jgi:hypothetical protein